MTHLAGEDMVTVPAEATEEMLDATVLSGEDETWSREKRRAIYRDMVAAAPKASDSHESREDMVLISRDTYKKLKAWNERYPAGTALSYGPAMQAERELDAILAELFVSTPPQSSSGEAEGLLRRLVKWIEYASHKSTCRIWPEKNLPCTCGLTELHADTRLLAGEKPFITELTPEGEMEEQP